MTLLLLLLLSIFGSFFFSGSETGFISWNPFKVAHRAAKGELNGRVALYLMNHKDRFLSTVLIGNNICNVAAALVFAQFFLMVDTYIPLDLSRIPSPESWFLTPVMVLFAEMLPKTLYRTYPFRLTMKSIPVLGSIYVLFFPLSWLFSQVSKAFRRTSEAEGVTFRTKAREEMVLVAVEGARRGNIFETANQLMENTLNLRERSIRSIAIDLDTWKKTQSVFTLSQKVSDTAKGLTGDDDEVIVFRDDLSEPVGFVSLFDVVLLNSRRVYTFGDIVKPLPYFRSSMTLLSCLRRMKENAPRFFIIREKDETPVAILDKMDLFEAAFVKLPYKSLFFTENA
ncbi:MAG: CNNM domain-containing protein [Chitinispirillaceae bacterium]